ncbi:hypothetical protein AC20117_06135 [Arthrobacter crystallopoietes]|nr:hypothetical protein AC20117_06135 [Arthrobacter crystallopoietes]
MSRPAVVRRPNPFQALVAVICIPMAILVPVWVVAGRVLFGISGPMVSILAFTLGPVLLLLLLFAGVKTVANAVRVRPFGAPLKTSALLVTTYLVAFGFGFTVPDFGENGGSILTALAGESALGMSIALCNPLGIISIALSITVTVVCYRDAKYARH